MLQSMGLQRVGHDWAIELNWTECIKPAAISTCNQNLKIWIRDFIFPSLHWGFPCGSAGKESACNVGDLGLIPGLRRYPGEGKAAHSSVLAWRIPCSRTQRVRRDWVTFTPLLLHTRPSKSSEYFILQNGKAWTNHGLSAPRRVRVVVPRRTAQLCRGRPWRAGPHGLSWHVIDSQ